MIHVSYRGRLGNNLFQFAFAAVLSRLSGVPFSAGPIAGFPGTFGLRSEPVPEPAPGACLIPKHGAGLSLAVWAERARREEIIVHGYPHNTCFYSPHLEWLRPLMLPEAGKYLPTGEEHVVLHLRLGDYFAAKNHGRFSYPLGGVEGLLARLSFDECFMVTDEPTHAGISALAERFPCRVVSEGLLPDYRTLLHARRLIMSPSTFSWWPAFTGDAREIYCPENVGIWRSEKGRHLRLEGPHVQHWDAQGLIQKPSSISASSGGVERARSKSTSRACTPAGAEAETTKKPARTFTISLCTTCMGRAQDLIRTLPANLEDNAAYGDLEIVLLDYNSPDGLGRIVQDSLMPWIESGRLTYARTTEPQWYSMSHSRNVAFRLARGEIVCNVDADNWTGPGFAAELNRLANLHPERAVFTKGRRLLRGRIAFFKREWEELLGGYDEGLQGYGHDDRDLVTRAEALGFHAVYFGGQYVRRLRTPAAQRVTNMRDKSWRRSEDANRRRSETNIRRGILKANTGCHWGAARLEKNFREEIQL